MSFPIITAVATPLDPPAGVSLQTASLILLAVGLIALWRAVVSLRSRVDELAAAKPVLVPSPVAVAPAPSSRSVQPERLTPELMAVIAAAVHTTLKCRTRIVGVRPAGAEHQAWSLEGRRRIFDSHRPR